MKPIELSILFHSDETHTLKNVGVDYNFDDCELRHMIFYNINAISPYFDDGIEYTSIHANGSEYICTMTYSELKQKIETE